MGKNTRTSLDRLQRSAQTDRPDESERERVADQLLTQDQLRRIDKNLSKIAPLPTPDKGPPKAQPNTRDRRPQSTPESTGRSEPTRLRAERILQR